MAATTSDSATSATNASDSAGYKNTTTRDGGPSPRAAEKKKATPTPTPEQQPDTRRTSCEPCRLRKVKCIFESPAAAGIGGCSQCERKGIKCFKGAAELQLAPRLESAERINQKTASAQALSSMLLSFSAVVSLNITKAIDFSRIHAVCQEASYDLDSLTAVDQALALAAVATATGVGRLRLDFHDIKNSKDLDLLVVSRGLVAQAIEAADRAGVHRKASLGNVQCLRLLMVATSDPIPGHLRRSTDFRAYQRSFTNQLRELHQAGNLSPGGVGPFFWSTVLFDAIASAASGQPPAYTEDDLATLAPHIPVEGHQMLKLITLSKLPEAGFAICSAAICRLAWLFNSRITCLKARRKPKLDIEFLERLPTYVRHIQHLVATLEENLLVSAGGNPAEKIPFWLPLLQLICPDIYLLGIRELDPVVYNTQPRSPQLSDTQRCQRAHRYLQQHFIQAMRSYIPQCTFLERRGATVADGLSSYFFVVRLKTILQCPVHEDGPIEGEAFFLHEKAELAQRHLAICTSLSETSLAVRDELPWLIEQVTALVQRTYRSTLQTLQVYESSRPL